jgi:metal-responsive CopG/Arc/MetJ family transcriptional regulator
MTDSTVEHLIRRASSRQLRTMTLRIPEDLYQEIDSFCKEGKLIRAVVVRLAVELGWKEILDSVENPRPRSSE